MISSMCLDAKLKFLTFVVFNQLILVPLVAFGAPSTDIQPSGIILNDNHEYFFPRKSIVDTTDFGFGVAEGVFDKSKQIESINFLSVGRSHYQDNKTAYDYKIVLASNNFVGLDAGYRWVFPEIHRNEPYLKIGASMFLNPRDQIANFIDYQRYYLQAAIGFDNLLNFRRAIKFEVGGRAGNSGNHIYAVVVYGLAD